MLDAYIGGAYNVDFFKGEPIFDDRGRLLKVGRQYEKEIVEFTEGSKELELIYDNMMDLLIEVKQQINEKK